jgi:type IV secretory pathway VirB10-like protein
MLGLPSSPNTLPPAGAPRGFKRLNRRAVVAIAAVPVAVAGVLGYDFYQRATLQAPGTQEAADVPESATGVVAQPTLAQLAAAAPRPRAVARPVIRSPQKAAATKPDDKLLKKFVEARWKKYYADLGALWDYRYAQELKAMREPDTRIPVNVSGGAAAAPEPVEGPSAASVPAAQSTAATSGVAGLGGLDAPGGMPGTAGQAGITAAQRQQERFMGQAGDIGQNDVLMAGRKPPPGPYAVMAGSYIPLVLETAVNSDSPGTFVARVSNDVYNTRNGACVIIPAGSTVLGKYDSEVGMGQSRLPGVINRVIYPDTSSVDLGAMEAASQSGAAGFDADVDNHLLERLGNGLVVGIAGLGNYVGGLLPFGSGGIIGAPASAVGAIGEFGLNIPPTLTAAPGTRLTVITGQDLNLAPWSCDGRRIAPQLPIMTAG